MRMAAFRAGVACALLPACFVAIADVLPGLRIDRAGDVVIGQSFSSLRAKAEWIPEGYSEDPELDCEIYRGGGLPSGISMMVMGDRVTRFHLEREGMAGLFGIRIGDSEASALRSLPGSVVIGPHEYGDEGDHYLTWRDPDRNLGFRAETWDGKVTTTHWGEWEATQLIEGCL